MYQAEQKDGTLIITFKGRMDTNACSEVEIAIKAEIEKAGLPVFFDLKDVDFVSSAFLRICLYTAKKVGAGKFQVTNAGPLIKQVFKIAGMDQFI